MLIAIDWPNNPCLFSGSKIYLLFLLVHSLQGIKKRLKLRHDFASLSFIPAMLGHRVDRNNAAGASSRALKWASRLIVEALTIGC